MDDACNWSKLPNDIVIRVVHRLSCVEDYIRFTAVCKSWKSATQDYKPLLPPKYPLLLLAEDVVPGSILSDGEFDPTAGYGNDGIEYYDDDDDEDNDDDNNYDYYYDEGTDDNSDRDDAALYEAKKHLRPFNRYDHRNNSIGSSRGLYSLSTGETYELELPEAAGRLILGANHGWLLTLGRDLKIHLLHPLLRYQINLPSMLTFPTQFFCGTPEQRFDMFITKVILSSKVTKDDSSSPATPIVMASYGQCGMHLAFYRLGDEKWTRVEIQSRPTDDFVYHRGRFYTVNNGGEVYVCDLQNTGGPKATKIGSLPFETFQDRKYLVESISGTLLLLVHNCKTKHFYPYPRRPKYRTAKFLVWKVELQYSDDSLQIPSCSLIKEKNLGKQAIFVGKGSSVSVPSSETIRPNCIYFTDDREDCYRRVGGGHDMGIFNMENRTIEPHFPGKSIHFISPPLWYI